MFLAFYLLEKVKKLSLLWYQSAICQYFTEIKTSFHTKAFGLSFHFTVFFEQYNSRFHLSDVQTWRDSLPNFGWKCQVADLVDSHDSKCDTCDLITHNNGIDFFLWLHFCW